MAAFLLCAFPAWNVSESEPRLSACWTKCFTHMSSFVPPNSPKATFYDPILQIRTLRLRQVISCARGCIARAWLTAEAAQRLSGLPGNSSELSQEARWRTGLLVGVARERAGVSGNPRSSGLLGCWEGGQGTVQGRDVLG